MTGSFTRKIQTVRAYHRKHGFLRLCTFLLRHLFVVSRMAVFERDLSRPLEDVRVGIPITVKLLRNDESGIDRLVGFWPDFYSPPESTAVSIRQMIVDRLSAGEECMTAEYEGRIVHMNWIGFQSTHLFNKYVTRRGISDKEALSYNTYTAPAYRGNRVAEAVFAQIFGCLAARGYKAMLGYVGYKNRASMKIVSRLFRNRTHTLYHFSVLGFGRFFLMKNRPKPETLG